MLETSSPKVSVVLCTYNDDKYIRESIDSVLSQSFDDFEFIIWNDGSTDSTEQIIKSYSDSRIRYFYHENTGLGIALHLACEKARGKYIARIDGDDVCMPLRLRKQVSYLETHPNCILLSSSCYFIDEEGEILGRSINCTWNSVIKKTLKVGSATIHPAAMFRTDAYRKTCGYIGLKSSQDRVLWSKMKDLGDFHNLQGALIKYRIIGSSLSHVLDTNPYSSVLEQLRRKMITDATVSERDVSFYNEIYMEGKRNVRRIYSLKYKPKIEEKIYGIMKPLLGDYVTASLLIFIKNIICYLIK